MLEVQLRRAFTTSISPKGFEVVEVRGYDQLTLPGADSANIVLWLGSQLQYEYSNKTLGESNKSSKTNDDPSTDTSSLESTLIHSWLYTLSTKYKEVYALFHGSSSFSGLGTSSRESTSYSGSSGTTTTNSSLFDFKTYLLDESDINEGLVEQLVYDFDAGRDDNFTGACHAIGESIRRMVFGKTITCDMDNESCERSERESESDSKASSANKRKQFRENKYQRARRLANNKSGFKLREKGKKELPKDPKKLQIKALENPLKAQQNFVNKTCGGLNELEETELKLISFYNSDTASYSTDIGKFLKRGRKCLNVLRKMQPMAAEMRKLQLEVESERKEDESEDSNTYALAAVEGDENDNHITANIYLQNITKLTKSILKEQSRNLFKLYMINRVPASQSTTSGVFYEELNFFLEFLTSNTSMEKNDRDSKSDFLKASEIISPGDALFLRKFIEEKFLKDGSKSISKDFEHSLAFLVDILDFNQHDIQYLKEGRFKNEMKEKIERVCDDQNGGEMGLHVENADYLNFFDNDSTKQREDAADLNNFTPIRLTYSLCIDINSIRYLNSDVDGPDSSSQKTVSETFLRVALDLVVFPKYQHKLNDTNQYAIQSRTLSESNYGGANGQYRIPTTSCTVGSRVVLLQNVYSEKGGEIGRVVEILDNQHVVVQLEKKKRGSPRDTATGHLSMSNIYDDYIYLRVDARSDFLVDAKVRHDESNDHVIASSKEGVSNDRLLTAKEMKEVILSQKEKLFSIRQRTLDNSTDDDSPAADLVFLKKDQCKEAMTIIKERFENKKHAIDKGDFDQYPLCSREIIDKLEELEVILSFQCWKELFFVDLIILNDDAALLLLELLLNS